MLAEVRGQLLDSVVEHDPSTDLAFVEHELSGRFGFVAWFNGRYRAIAQRWKGYRLPSFRGSMASQIDIMRQVVELRAERATLEAAKVEGRALFGAHWRGEASN